MKLIAKIRKFYRVDLEFVSQAARFFLVGIVNTAVGYGLFYVGVTLGFLPELALAIATALGALFNYFSTGRFVFRHHSLDRLPRFIGAYILIYLFNALLLRLGLSFGLAPQIAQLILLPAIVTLSFFTFRWLVFNRKNAS